MFRHDKADGVKIETAKETSNTKNESSRETTESVLSESKTSSSSQHSVQEDFVMVELVICFFLMEDIL